MKEYNSPNVERQTNFDELLEIHIIKHKMPSVVSECWHQSKFKSKNASTYSRFDKEAAYK
jgi:hypothetical protein